MITLGKIGACYGIYGWVKVFSFTERVENIFNYQPWFLKKGIQNRKVEFESWCYHRRGVIVKLKDIDNRSIASLLVNYKITINSFQLPKLKNGIYYWKDIIGCNVVNIKGYKFGKVIDIIKTGSNDVLIVKKNIKEISKVKEQLIPFLDKQVIKRVDLITQIIEVDWDPNF